MKIFIRTLLIHYCAKQATKHQIRLKAIDDKTSQENFPCGDGLNRITAMGTIVIARNKWLNRLNRLSEW